MDIQKKTTVQRDWGSTVGLLVASVVLILISVGLCMTVAEGLISGTLSVLPGIAGIICFFMALASGKAPCPNCGKELSCSPTNNDAVLCGNCHLYFEGKNKELWQTDPERVADSPLYGAPLPEKFTFPEGCCVCGQPATQRIAISTTSTNASTAVTAPTIGMSSTTRVTVEVPHCASHKDGAMLSGTAKDTKIVFRSYPYLRAFCEANGVMPG